MRESLWENDRENLYERMTVKRPVQTWNWAEVRYLENSMRVWPWSRVSELRTALWEFIRESLVSSVVESLIKEQSVSSMRLWPWFGVPRISSGLKLSWSEVLAELYESLTVKSGVWIAYRAMRVYSWVSILKRGRKSHANAYQVRE